MSDLASASPEPVPSSSGVTVLAVAHNQEAGVRTLLDALSQPAPTRHEIILVDNGSEDGTATVAREFEAVTLLRLSKRFRRTRALNIAVRTAKTEFLLLARPGVSLMPGAVQTLADALQASPEVGAVSPLVTDESGQVQLKSHGLPSAADLYGAWRLGGSLPGSPVSQDQATDVHSAEGGLWLVRREFVKGMNFFDERYAGVGSLWELFFQLRNAGKLLRILPHCRVVETTQAGEPDPDAITEFVVDASAYVGKRTGLGTAVGWRMKAIAAALGDVASAPFRGRPVADAWRVAKGVALGPPE